MKVLIQAAPVSKDVSWWASKSLQADREAFDQQAAKEQPRMAGSVLGQRRGRVISTDELEPR